MNISMNSASLPAAADATVSGAANSTLDASGLPLDPALAAQPGAASLGFLQFMDLNAAAPLGAAPLPELDGAAPGDALDPAPLPVAEAAEATEPRAEAAPNETLLAAMAMPLMPSMMMALPAGTRFAAGSAEQTSRAADAAPSAGADGAIALPTAAALPTPVQLDAGAQLARAGAASAQPAQAAVAQQAAPVRDAAVLEAQAAPANAAGFGVAPAAPQAAPRDGATVTLSGPPTAWRQSLQEALGERLNLQLTRNAEQAVIRLDPPMLGRVEISIRHIAGSLEVNITATHGEVLRQLNTVSDNLRSDLAGRQYTDVSVNVSQATPRAQAGAGFGADTQGRGRQQGQEQDERAPGAALADAHQPNTAFSLSGRA